MGLLFATAPAWLYPLITRGSMMAGSALAGRIEYQLRGQSGSIAIGPVVGMFASSASVVVASRELPL